MTTPNIDLMTMFKPAHTVVLFSSNSMLPNLLWEKLNAPACDEKIMYSGLNPSPDCNIVNEVRTEIQDWVKNVPDRKGIYYFLDLVLVSRRYENLTNFEELCQMLLEIDKIVQQYNVVMVIGVTMQDPYLVATMTDAWIKHYAMKQSEHFTMLSMTGGNTAQITVANGEFADKTIECKFYQNLVYTDLLKKYFTPAVEDEILKNLYNRGIFRYWWISEEERWLCEKKHNPEYKISGNELKYKLRTFKASSSDIYDYVTRLKYYYNGSIPDEMLKTLYSVVSELKLDDDSKELKTLIGKAKTQISETVVEMEKFAENVRQENDLEHYVMLRAAMQKWKLDKF